MKTNWREQLFNNGFIPLENGTQTYGNGTITGSINYWDSSKCKLIPEYDLYDSNGNFKSKFIVEVFCPFLFEESNRALFNSAILFSAEDLQKYLASKSV